MPIYEYIAVDSYAGCDYCSKGFDVIQKIQDQPVPSCPRCAQPVIKLISPCAVLVGESNPNADTVKKVREYEKQGMFSHAAEMADKHGMEDRARENYRKAGYNF